MRQQKQPASVILGRALRLRCPSCGHGRLFAGIFRMHERCDSCGLKYERAPGYFLGSTYINYGVTALLITVLFVVLRFRLNISREALLWPLLAVCLLTPVVFFRHARALWLGMDSYFDSEGFRTDPDGRPPQSGATAGISPGTQAVSRGSEGSSASES